jgi:GTPase
MMNDIGDRQRVVAIVGRPNVGKSALFNRLTGKRTAIVHEMAGVTRDRLAGEAVWNEERFRLVDTGGIGVFDGLRTGDEIEDGTHRQAESALGEAACAIMVVDVQLGLTPLDAEVAGRLHRSGIPVVLAANKSDNEKLAADAVDFESLGFPVRPISALHNIGIDELMEPVLASLPPATDSPTIDNPLKVAIVGRPNAGKSSFINRLLRDERVLVSNVAGTTRDSIEIPFSIGSGSQARHYIFIDTAGIRQRRKVRDTVEHFSMIRAHNSIRHCDVAVLLLDAEKGPSAQEKKIAAMILKERKGCLIIVNKWDLAEGAVTQRQYGKAMSEALPFLEFVPVLFASALSGYNIRRAIEAIDHVGAQIETRMTTGVLNRVLHAAFDKYQPPAAGGRRLKFFYATQVRSNPIIIRLFVNEPSLRKSSYESYLVNCLRNSFGLEGAPVVLQFRGREQSARRRGEPHGKATP